MKILISSFVCDPHEGSESGVGWTWTRAAALRHDVWLLVGAQHRAAILAALQREPGLRLHPVFLGDAEHARRSIRHKAHLMAYYLHFQRLAHREGLRLQREIGFDAGHHLTFASDSLPAGLAYIPGLPLVWGPVGGSTWTHPQLYRWLGWRGRVQQGGRDLLLPVIRGAFGRRIAADATLVIAMNSDVAHSFRSRAHVVIEPNVAVEASLLAEASGADVDASWPTSAGHPPVQRTAVYAGRLLSFKGIRLAIHSLAQPQAADWRLLLYGEGSERQPAAALAARLGVADRVEFLGVRPRREVLAAYRRADAMLFLSFHDSASWAVAEAVSLGCPVICLDRGGPPEIVGDVGTVVEALPAHDLPARVAAALASVAGRRPPSDRWQASRLPDLLDEWYRLART